MKRGNRLTVEAISTRLRAWFISYDGKLPMDEQAYTQLKEIVEDFGDKESIQNNKFIKGLMKWSYEQGKAEQQKPRVTIEEVKHLVTQIIKTERETKESSVNHPLITAVNWFKSIGMEVSDGEQEF